MRDILEPVRNQERIVSMGPAKVKTKPRVGVLRKAEGCVEVGSPLLLCLRPGPQLPLQQLGAWESWPQTQTRLTWGQMTKVGAAPQGGSWRRF